MLARCQGGLCQDENACSPIQAFSFKHIVDKATLFFLHIYIERFEHDLSNEVLPLKNIVAMHMNE